MGRYFLEKRNYSVVFAGFLFDFSTMLAVVSSVGQSMMVGHDLGDFWRYEVTPRT